jgi:hypothetical protein
MALTVAAFKTFFPEFAITGDAAKIAARDAMIQLYIDDATTEIGDYWKDVCGRDWTDKGVKYLAAHKLAISPFGLNAKLSSKEGKSVYGEEYMRLSRIVSFGRGRVSGYSDLDLAKINDA